MRGIKGGVKQWGRAVLLALSFLGAAGTTSAWAETYTLGDFSFLPPFLGADVKPNILLIIDSSGSMGHCAYPDPGKKICYSSTPSTNYQAYDPDDPSDPSDSVAIYYGYFEPDKCYTYGSSKFSPDVAGDTDEKEIVAGVPVCKLGEGGLPDKWDGNFLNWATMRRMDIVKWALTGGQCNAARSSPNSCDTFRAQSAADLFTKRFPVGGTRLVPSPYHTGTRCMYVVFGDFGMGTDDTGTCPTTEKGPHGFQVRIDAGAKQSGVIQKVGDRARFGLMQFNTKQGGKVVVEVGGNLVPLINAVEGFAPLGFTPLAESLYEAGRYFAQIPAKYFKPDFKVNVNNDPYCFGEVDPPVGIPGCRNDAQGQWVYCCRSFALVFTDGEPTQDEDIPDTIKEAAHPIHTDHADDHHNCHAPSCGGSGGSHYLDDVAYWAHTTDLRPEGDGVVAGAASPNITSYGLKRMQNLTIYTFFAFGEGSKILQDAAKAGGFEDSNGNNLPDLTTEWDRKTWTDGVALETPDGVPDTYFEAKTGDAIEENLLAALNDALQKSASGTSVSFLSATSSGEGAVYQSYFFPLSNEPLGPVSWVGYLHGLFLDGEGQLREDTTNDGRLVLQQDKVISTYFDEGGNVTKVKRCAVDAVTGEVTATCEDLGGLEEIRPIWEGGELLAMREASDPREITTWVDSNGDGDVDSGEVISFEEGNKATLKPYLRAVSDTESGEIIEFIRGEAVAGYRNRIRTLKDGSEKVWKLGDILYSDPIAVRGPRENYSEQFGDESYAPFSEKYRNRRNVVYVGANDGMLHAFNAGFFHSGDDPSTEAVEHGYITKNEDDDAGGIPLGKELWAFIPQELLPHLRWLTQTDYTKDKHVSFVDGSPRIADVQIFDVDDTHPGGWGTILIGSMRGGGGLIKADINQDGDTDDIGEDRFRSAYFAFDVTDPDAADYPKLLWVFTEPDLGFSNSFPAVVRLAEDKWYAVFGSGPTTYKGERITSAGNKFDSGISTSGFIYAIDLKTGKYLDGVAARGKFTTDIAGTDANAFMGDPVAINAERDRNAESGEQDYVFDAVYIGKTFRSGADDNGDSILDWHGKLYRFLTNKAEDPAGWTLSVMVDPQKPVLVQPTVVRDRARRPWVIFGTGRFFSSGTDSDQGDRTAQAIYAIKEDSNDGGCWNAENREWIPSCGNTVSVGTLFDATNLDSEIRENGECVGSACEGASSLYDLVSSNEAANRPGWVLNLAEGERVLRRATFLAGVVAVPTYTPTTSEVCNTLGTSTLYALYYQSGTAFGSRNNSTGPLGLSSDGESIARSVSLGQGIAAKVAMVATKDAVTGYIQTSTGTIQQVNVNITDRNQQGIKIFREETE